MLIYVQKCNKVKFCYHNVENNVESQILGEEQIKNKNLNYAFLITK